MSTVDTLGYIAAGLVLAAFCMESIALLRAVAIASNIAFIGYALGKGLMPVFALHVVLLPVNVLRLVQLAARHRAADVTRAGDRDGPPR